MMNIFCKFQVNSMATIGGGVFVQVWGQRGEVSNLSECQQNFIQTFVLIPCEYKRGRYFIRNDMLRYLHGCLLYTSDADDE